MPSSSSSPSVIEQLHSPTSSPHLHDNQRWLLSASAKQSVQDSDDEFNASTHLVHPSFLSESVLCHGKRRTPCP